MTSAPAERPLPVNHVFVDFENVHSFDLALPGRKPMTFTLLVGANQTRMDTGVVEQLLTLAGSVQLVRLESSGRNALDFALAYYVGRKVEVDPTGYFHIVSGDKGFDPLVGHLCSRGIKARRHDGFESLTFAGPPKGPAPVPAAPAALAKPPAALPKPPASLPEAPLDRALAQLKRNPKNRPGSSQKLVSYLLNLCGKDSTAAQAQGLVAALQKKGHVKVDEKGAVRYQV